MTTRTWDDIQARLEARRVPVVKMALAFDGIPRDYWREEVRLGCAVALARLRSLCQERGADYDKTVEGLR